MPKFSIQRAISSALVAALFVTQTFTFDFTKGAEPITRYGLVAILVDEDTYKNTESYGGLRADGTHSLKNTKYDSELSEKNLSDRIDRYARDVQGSLENTKALIIQTRSDESPVKIAQALEKLYFDGIDADDSEITELTGVVLIGNVPIPVVNKNGYRYPSLFPYTDFVEKTFPYDAETDIFSYNSASAESKPEVWHGVIRPPITGEEGNELLAAYFDKNHLFRTGNEDFSNFDAKIFYNDISGEFKGANRQAYADYDRYLRHWEEISYLRYTKDFLKKLYKEAEEDFGDLLEVPEEDKDEIQAARDEMMDEIGKTFDEAVASGEMPAEYVPDLSNANFEFDSDTLFDDMPDIQSKKPADKYMRRYYELFRKYLSTVNDLVSETGRYKAAQEDATGKVTSDVDTFVSLISKKDEYTREYLREVNDRVEYEIDEIAKTMAKNIPVAKNLTFGGRYRVRNTRTDADGNTYYDYDTYDLSSFTLINHGYKDAPSPSYCSNGEGNYINGVATSKVTSVSDCLLRRGSSNLIEGVKINSFEDAEKNGEKIDSGDSFYCEWEDSGGCASINYGFEKGCFPERAITPIFDIRGARRDVFLPNSAPNSQYTDYRACFDVKGISTYQTYQSSKNDVRWEDDGDYYQYDYYYPCDTKGYDDNGSPFSSYSSGFGVDKFLRCSLKDYQNRDQYPRPSYPYPSSLDSYNILLSYSVLDLLAYKGHPIDSNDFSAFWVAINDIVGSSNSTSITQTSPPGASGVYDITVTVSLSEAKEISSVYTHKEPINETINAQLAAGYSRDLPIDDPRYTTFLDKNNALARIDYPNIFEAVSLTDFQNMLKTAEKKIASIPSGSSYDGRLSALVNASGGVDGAKITDALYWKFLNIDEKHDYVLRYYLDPDLEPYTAKSKNGYEIMYLTADSALETDSEAGDMSLKFNVDIPGEVREEESSEEYNNPEESAAAESESSGGDDEGSSGSGGGGDGGGGAVDILSWFGEIASWLGSLEVGISSGPACSDSMFGMPFGSGGDDDEWNEDAEDSGSGSGSSNSGTGASSGSGSSEGAGTNVTDLASLSVSELLELDTDFDGILNENDAEPEENDANDNDIPDGADKTATLAFTPPSTALFADSTDAVEIPVSAIDSAKTVVETDNFTLVELEMVDGADIVKIASANPALLSFGNASFKILSQKKEGAARLRFKTINLSKNFTSESFTVNVTKKQVLLSVYTEEYEDAGDVYEILDESGEAVSDVKISNGDISLKKDDYSVAAKPSEGESPARYGVFDKGGKAIGTLIKIPDEEKVTVSDADGFEKAKESGGGVFVLVKDTSLDVSLSQKYDGAYELLLNGERIGLVSAGGEIFLQDREKYELSSRIEDGALIYSVGPAGGNGVTADVLIGGRGSVKVVEGELLSLHNLSSSTEGSPAFALSEAEEATASCHPERSREAAERRISLRHIGQVLSGQDPSFPVTAATGKVFDSRRMVLFLRTALRSVRTLRMTEFNEIPDQVSLREPVRNDSVKFLSGMTDAPRNDKGDPEGLFARALGLLRRSAAKAASLLAMTGEYSRSAMARASFDSDGDGLPDLAEYFIGTNVGDSDTDGDSFSDFEEVFSAYSPKKKSTKLFSDLSQNHPYFSAIIELYLRGVLRGYSDGTFKPDQAVTREEFMKMDLASICLACADFTAAKKETLEASYFKNPFPDTNINPNLQYCVYEGKVDGIISGYQDGYFKPKNNISRAEAVKVLLETADLAPSNPTPPSGKPWYYLYIVEAQKQHIFPEKQFAELDDDSWAFPKWFDKQITENGAFLTWISDSVSRAEFAVMAVNTLELNDCFSVDSDSDGIPDASEKNQFGTDPNAADTDKDGASDLSEVVEGTSPLDSTSGGTGVKRSGTGDTGNTGTGDTGTGTGNTGDTGTGAGGTGDTGTGDTGTGAGGTGTGDTGTGEIPDQDSVAGATDPVRNDSIDTDRDGISDTDEDLFGLNKNDPGDASLVLTSPFKIKSDPFNIKGKPGLYLIAENIETGLGEPTRGYDQRLSLDEVLDTETVKNVYLKAEIVDGDEKTMTDDNESVVIFTVTGDSLQICESDQACESANIIEKEVRVSGGSATSQIAIGKKSGKLSFSAKLKTSDIPVKDADLEILPGQPYSIELQPVSYALPASPQAGTSLSGRIVDMWKNPVYANYYEITLSVEGEGGFDSILDEDPEQAGFQVRTYDGTFKVRFISGAAEGNTTITASLGDITKTITLRTLSGMSLVVSSDTTSLATGSVNTARISVTAVDASGLPVTDYHETPEILLLDPLFGTLSGSTAFENASAETVFTASNHAGQALISVSAPGLTTKTLTLSILPGKPVSIALTADSSILRADASDTATITARLYDTFGNFVNTDSSTPIAFHITEDTSEFGTIASGASETAKNGEATATLKATSITGPIHLVASSEGLASGTLELSTIKPFDYQTVKETQPQALYVSLLGKDAGIPDVPNYLGGWLLFSGKIEAVTTLLAPASSFASLANVSNSGKIEIVDSNIIPSVISSTPGIPLRVLLKNFMTDSGVAEVFYKLSSSAISIFDTVTDYEALPAGISILQSFNPETDDAKLTSANDAARLFVKGAEALRIYPDGRIEQLSSDIFFSLNNDAPFFALDVKYGGELLLTIFLKDISASDVTLLPDTFDTASFSSLPSGIYVKPQSQLTDTGFEPQYSGNSLNAPKGIRITDTKTSLAGNQKPGFYYQSLEDAPKTKGIGFEGDNKHILLFSAGETVGEANKHYASDIGINLGDPTVSLRSPNLISKTGYTQDVGRMLLSGSTIIREIAPIDFNVDGIQDLLLLYDGDSSSSHVKALENYESQHEFKDQGDILNITNGVDIMKGADFDQDGDEDLVVATREPCKVGETCVYLYKNSSGNFEREHLGLDIGPDLRVKDMETADFNNDKYPDLLLVDSSGDLLVYYNKKGSILTKGQRIDNLGSKIDSSEQAASDVLVSFEGMPEPTYQEEYVKLSLPVDSGDDELSLDETTLTDDEWGALSKVISNTGLSVTIGPSSANRYEEIFLAAGTALPDSTKTAVDVNGETMEKGDTVQYTVVLANDSASTVDILISDEVAGNIKVDPASFKCLDCGDASLQVLKTGQSLHPYVISGLSLPAKGDIQIQYEGTVETTPAIDISVGNNMDENYPSDDFLDILARPEDNPDLILTYYYSSGTKSEDGVTKVQYNRYRTSPPNDEYENPYQRFSDEDLTTLDENGYPKAVKDYYNEQIAKDEDKDGLSDEWDELGEEEIPLFTCEGGCIPLPINYAFFAPGAINIMGIPGGFDPGWPIFAAVVIPGCPLIGCTWPPNPVWMASIPFRLYLSPTLTGGLGVSMCLGPFPYPFGWCFVTAAPIQQMLGICDAITGTLSGVLAAAGSMASSIGSGSSVFSSSGGQGGGSSNISIAGMPPVIPDWIARQAQEIITKLTDWPHLYIYLPDFGIKETLGSLTDGSEEKMNAIGDIGWSPTNLVTFLNSLPLVKIEVEDVIFKLPWFSSPEYADNILKEWEEFLDQLFTLETYYKGIGIDFNAGELINSVQRNIEALQAYKELPYKLLEYRNLLSKYVYQIVCILDAISDMLGGWLIKNIRIYYSWLKAIDDFITAIMTWRFLIDFSIAFMDSCDNCTTDRWTLLELIFKLLIVIPAPPVIPFPKWPDIVLDFSDIQAGITFTIPNLRIKTEPLILPKPPSLPSLAPNTSLTLPGIPIIPAPPDLPDLPDLPSIPLLKLPDLPPPPKLPALPGALTAVTDILKKVMEILCMLITGKLGVPEFVLKTEVEKITQRGLTPLLSIDTLFSFQWPTISLNFVDTIKVLTHVNLQMDMGFVMDMVKDVARTFNTSVTDFSNIWNAVSNAFENVTEIPSETIDPEVNVDLRSSLDDAQRLRKYGLSEKDVENLRHHPAIAASLLKLDRAIADMEQEAALYETENVSYPDSYRLIAEQEVLDPYDPYFNRTIEDIRDNLSVPHTDEMAPAYHNLLAVEEDLLAYFEKQEALNVKLKDAEPSDIVRMIAEASGTGFDSPFVLAAASGDAQVFTSTTQEELASVLKDGGESFQNEIQERIKEALPKEEDLEALREIHEGHASSSTESLSVIPDGTHGAPRSAPRNNHSRSEYLTQRGAPDQESIITDGLLAMTDVQGQIPDQERSLRSLPVRNDKGEIASSLSAAAPRNDSGLLAMADMPDLSANEPSQSTMPKGLFIYNKEKEINEKLISAVQELGEPNRIAFFDYDQDGDEDIVYSFGGDLYLKENFTKNPKRNFVSSDPEVVSLTSLLPEAPAVNGFVASNVNNRLVSLNWEASDATNLLGYEITSKPSVDAFEREEVTATHRVHLIPEKSAEETTASFSSEVKFEALSGEIELESGKIEADSAEASGTISPGDGIATGNNSEAVLTFDDGGTMTLDEKTFLFVPDITKDTVIEVVQGEVAIAAGAGGEIGAGSEVNSGANSNISAGSSVLSSGNAGAAGVSSALLRPGNIIKVGDAEVTITMPDGTVIELPSFIEFTIPDFEKVKATVSEVEGSVTIKTTPRVLFEKGDEFTAENGLLVHVTRETRLEFSFEESEYSFVLPQDSVFSLARFAQGTTIKVKKGSLETFSLGASSESQQAAEGMLLLPADLLSTGSEGSAFIRYSEAVQYPIGKYETFLYDTLSTPSNPSYELSIENGNYSSKIFALLQNGGRSTESASILLAPQVCADHSAPYANAGPKQQQVPIYQTITLDASPSFDTHSNISGYTWDTTPEDDTDSADDTHNTTLTLGPFDKATSKTVELTVEDERGNTASQTIEVGVSVPDIFLNPSSGRDGMIEGYIELKAANMPIQILHQRSGAWDFLSTEKAPEGTVRTDAEGKFILDDTDQQSRLFILDSEQKIVAEISEESGRIGPTEDDFTVLAKPAQTGLPTRLELANPQDSMLATVFFVPDVNSDVVIEPSDFTFTKESVASLSGVHVRDLDTSDGYSFIKIPADDPSHPGGVFMSKTKTQRISSQFFLINTAQAIEATDNGDGQMLLIDTDGSVSFFNNSLSLQLSASDTLDDPALLQILLGETALAEMYISTRTGNGYSLLTGDNASLLFGTETSSPSDDSDQDGLPDSWERLYAFDPNDASDAASDADKDGLSNVNEYESGTNVLENDTDGDSMYDGWEILYGLNPLDASDAEKDADSDTLTNLEEFVAGLSPSEKDASEATIPTIHPFEPQEISANFSDVSSDDPLYPTLNDLVQKGVLQGYPDGTFKLQNNISRAEFTKIMLKILCMEPRAEAYEAPAVFTDIPYADSGRVWYYDETKESYLRGLITGYIGERDSVSKLSPFKPGNTITRAEAVKIVLEALNHTGVISLEKALKEYPLKASDPWYASYIEISKDLTDYLSDSSEVIREAFIVTKDEAKNPGEVLTRAQFITIAERVLNFTDCFSADNDSDGMPDYWEIRYGLDPENAKDASLDSDMDFLIALDEYRLSTDPSNADTDGDKFLDGNEVVSGTDPLSPDKPAGDGDSDGISDSQEKSFGTSATSADTDSDGLSDALEVVFGTDPWEKDTDNGGVSDGAERTAGTDLLNPFDDDMADSDHDGLSLYEETSKYGTDPYEFNVSVSEFTSVGGAGAGSAGTPVPRNADSDSDGLTDDQEKKFGTDSKNSDSDNGGMPDGAEIRAGSDPLDASDDDSDSDGLTDSEEKKLGTDPNHPDSDLGGASDGMEASAGTDPKKDGDDDSDSDGIPNFDEKNQYGTNSYSADTDNGGVSDGNEISLGLDPKNPYDDDSDTDGILDKDEKEDFKTDPFSADSDGGGVPDGDEIRADTDPLDDSDDDRDFDGLTNAEEEKFGTDPGLRDTDADGLSDKAEMENGTDPLSKDAGDAGALYNLEEGVYIAPAPCNTCPCQATIENSADLIPEDVIFAAIMDPERKEIYAKSEEVTVILSEAKDLSE